MRAEAATDDAMKVPAGFSQNLVEISWNQLAFVRLLKAANKEIFHSETLVDNLCK
jgi:hypothetical protein